MLNSTTHISFFSSDYNLTFHVLKGMLKTRKLLMIKRKLDGSTLTEMCSGFQNTNLSLLHLSVAVLNCSLCKSL